jgi:hypothetical protein
MLHAVDVEEPACDRSDTPTAPFHESSESEGRDAIGLIVEQLENPKRALRQCLEILKASANCAQSSSQWSAVGDSETKCADASSATSESPSAWLRRPSYDVQMAYVACMDASVQNVIHGRKCCRDSRADDVKGDSSKKRARLIPNKKRSAVVDQGMASSSASRVDPSALAVGSDLPEIQLPWLGPWADIAVFREASPLWSFLAQEKKAPESVRDGEESVFYIFDVENQDSEAQIGQHFTYWTSVVKHLLVNDDASQILMKVIPPKPAVHGGHRRQQFVSPVANSLALKETEMRGLLAKYNHQYRRPFPHHCIVELDSWKRVPKDEMRGAQIEYFAGPQFQICSTSLTECGPWDESDVDLDESSSSMIVPVKSDVFVEDQNWQCVRKVLGISFAALCWLLQHDFSAEQIEDAWTSMPIIKPGKKNRGVHSRRSFGHWRMQ